MSDNSKYGHIIFTDPGYSLLTIGSMFLGIVVVWMVNSMLLLPALAIDFDGYTMLLSGVNNAVLFVVVPYLFIKRRYIDYRIFAGINGRMSNRHIFTFAALALGTFLLTQSVQFFWFRLLDVIGVDYAIPTTPINGILGFVFGFIFVVIMPAITEEFLFRGIVMRSIAGVYGGAKAVLISALLFSLMHMNIANLPTTFIVGLTIGFAVYKSNCMKAGVIMHATHNGIVLILSMLKLTSNDATTTELFHPMIVIYAVLGALIMLVTMLLIHRRGALPGTLAATKAAIPHKHSQDLLPFAMAALLMLVRMI